MSRKRIVVGIATVEWRRRSLQLVVEALRPQVDAVRVYLNDGEVPDFLAPVECVRAQDALGDLGTHGKFYFCEREPSDYYLTCDDDIEYPLDYVERLVSELDRREGEAIVGIHGDVLAPPYKSQDGRQNFFYGSALEQPQAVHLLGTGTTILCPAKVPVTLDAFRVRNHADIQLAIWAQQRGVPMVAVPRPERWLKDYPEGFDERSHWATAKSSGLKMWDTLIASYDGWNLIPDPLR